MIDKEKLKQQMRRRLAPEGEDIKKIRDIVRSCKDQDITVHEFVGLVSPYTADQGAVLQRVVAEDLASFLTMARKIYETMTQDISDVLTNEHLQMIEVQNEKYELYTAKMMRAIDEIFEIAPKFDFDQYYKDPEEYVRSLYPEETQVV